MGLISGKKSTKIWKIDTCEKLQLKNFIKFLVFVIADYKIALLLTDAIFIILYLLSAVAFYPTKNICDFSNPLHCYGLFCAAFIVIFTLNSAINIAIIKINNRNIWFWKLGLLVLPIAFFLYY